MESNYRMDGEKFWKKLLETSKKTYITKPLNVHILAANVEDFINKYVNDRGLGYFSQQTIKTVHAKFQQWFNIIKNTDSAQYRKCITNALF